MTSLELLTHQLNASGGQLSRVLKGIHADRKDFRLHEGGMSFAEQVIHLGDAYQAVLHAAEGVKHEWGEFTFSATEWNAMVEELLAMREQAVAAVTVENDELIKMGADYIVSHDTYHIGQLATMRLNAHPDWDSYTIYG